MVGMRVVITGTLKGDADGFRDLGTRMSAFVKENEPGTVVYNWWLSEDGSTIVNEDGFTDAAAFLTHMGNAGGNGFLDEYMALIDITDVKIHGEVTDEAARGLAEQFGATIYGREFEL